jgi:P27 family predicted phage terminase small subunit
MGLRGPAPLPTNLHIIKGNPSKIPAARLNDALRPKVAIPDRPDYLLADAQTEWDRITPELKQLHIISQIDLAAVSMYCQLYAQWVATQRKIKEFGVDSMVELTPNGFKQITAWTSLSLKLHEKMQSILAEFGMTPSSRSRISANVCVNTDLFNDIEDVSNNGQEAETKTNGPGRFFKN